MSVSYINMSAISPQYLLRSTYITAGVNPDTNQHRYTTPEKKKRKVSSTSHLKTNNTREEEGEVLEGVEARRGLVLLL